MSIFRPRKPIETRKNPQIPAESAGSRRRNPFSRARAKRWWIRAFPGRKLLDYDGETTFYVAGGGETVHFGEFAFVAGHRPPRRPIP